MNLSLPNWFKNSRLATISVLFLVLIFVGGGFWFWQTANDDFSQKAKIEEIAPVTQDQKPDTLPPLTVTRVIDGDTIEAGEERIRLIGVNAEEIDQDDPEEKSSCRALLAKEYLTDLLLDQTIEIEIGQEPKDQYGRPLAYVFLAGELVNVKLIEEGLADVWLMSPNTKYYQQLIDAQVVGQEKQKTTDFCKNLKS